MYVAASRTKAVASLFRSWSQDADAIISIEPHTGAFAKLRQRSSASVPGLSFAHAARSWSREHASSASRQHSRSKLPRLQTRLSTMFTGEKLIPLRLFEAGAGSPKYVANESPNDGDQQTEAPQSVTEGDRGAKDHIRACTDGTLGQTLPDDSQNSTASGKTRSTSYSSVEKEASGHASSGRSPGEGSKSVLSWFLSQFFSHSPVAELDMKLSRENDNDGEKIWSATRIHGSAGGNEDRKDEELRGSDYAKRTSDRQDEKLKRFVNRFRVDTRSNTSKPTTPVHVSATEATGMVIWQPIDQPRVITRPRVPDNTSEASIDTTPADSALELASRSSASSSSARTQDLASSSAIPSTESLTSAAMIPRSTPVLRATCSTCTIRRLQTHTLCALMLLTLYLLITLLQAREQWLSSNGHKNALNALLAAHTTRHHTQHGRWLWTWIGQEGSGTWLEGLLWEIGVIL